MSEHRRNQCKVVTVLNIFAITTGMSIGFSAPNGKLFTSETSPLHGGPVGDFEISVMNSIVPIGALCSIHILGIISSRVGKRIMLLFVAILQMVIE